MTETITQTERVAAIVTCREGLALPKLAQKLAEQTDLTVDQAIGALRAAQLDALNDAQRIRENLH